MLACPLKWTLSFRCKAGLLTFFISRQLIGQQSWGRVSFESTFRPAVWALHQITNLSYSENGNVVFLALKLDIGHCQNNKFESIVLVSEHWTQCYHCAIIFTFYRSFCRKDCEIMIYLWFLEMRKTLHSKTTSHQSIHIVHCTIYIHSYITINDFLHYCWS